MSAWRIAVAFGLPLYITCFGFVSNIEAATIVPSSITADTSWTASSSPYVLDNDTTISSGVTVSIEPGVVVKLKNGVDFIVNGSLYAGGTEAEPIYFTSYQDDSVGGDINNDGSASVPQARDWRTIQFNSGSIGEFSHATIKYAGYFTSVQKSLPAIYNNGGDVSIEDSLITSNRIYGIAQVAGTLSIGNSEIANHDYGVVVTSGDTIIYDSEFSGHLISGIYAIGSGSLELNNNTFANNGIAVDVSLANERSFIHGGNTADGTGLNGIVIRGPVTGRASLTAGDMPYIVTATGGLSAVGAITISTDNNLKIAPTGELDIEAGVILKFTNNSSMIVDGSLDALGTKEESIYFTSIKDDEVGGDTNNDGSASVPASGSWRQIQFNNGSQANLEYTVVRFAGQRVGTDLTQSGINNNGGSLNIINTEILHNNQNGILNNNGTVIVSDSSIYDHLVYGVWNKTLMPLDARNNYWGDASGPYHSTLNPTGLGNDVSNNVLFDPWKTTVCKENCYSNVLFLPGIQASRLYVGDGEQVSDKLWEPSLIGGNADVASLALDANGQSTADIRTQDIIDETVFPYAGSNIYKGFMGFLDDLISDGVINDWTPFAYDWRYDVFDIVDNGTLYRDGSQAGVVKYPIEELESLAATSKSGKVTIIGHSNGGLLAKAIMRRLQEEGKADLVDQIIFIGTPHLGTPKALATVLHGYDQEALGGLVIDDAVARSVIKTLPGAYSLLPSENYLTNQATPLITFDDSESTLSFRNAYGFGVTNINEYRNFLLGTESTNNRSDVGFDSINQPIAVNSNMLNTALTKHLNELDNWDVPVGVEVSEIVGTGLLTLSGIEYREIDERVCGGFANCENIKLLKPYARFTKYGDETVVSNSANAFSSDISEYYVNLRDLNNQTLVSFGDTYVHANLSEITEIQELVSQLLKNEEPQNIEFINNAEPNFSEMYDIESIDSPVRLFATDVAGNVTGLVEEGGQFVLKKEIPGSDYFVMGSTKYLIIPKSVSRTTTLMGEGDGGYTLTVGAIGSDNQQTIVHQLNNATSGATMIAQFSKGPNGYGLLSVDDNGDGQIDKQMDLNGNIIKEPETEVTYSMLKDAILNLNVDKNIQTVLLVNVNIPEKHSLRIDQVNQEITALKRLAEKVLYYRSKKEISIGDSEYIIGLIEQLK